MFRLSWFLAIIALAGLSPRAGSAAEKERRTFALIVANNEPIDKDLAPLRYADNDAARYYELFQGAGAQTRILAVLDPIAQNRFPAAAAASQAPNHKNLQAQLQSIFKKMTALEAQGVETHFFFLYSGHGGIGPGNEGYITLLDRKFTRSELYRTVLAASTATFNHLVLDACNAYFFVNKRGAQAKVDGDHTSIVQEFLSREELKSYPNTGVILAASSESETHEWSRWEAGVFSHELRSALLGAGDADGDGHVTYAEAAAFVDAANAAVDQPRARLKVYYRPPAIRSQVSLMSAENFTGATTLVLPAALSGRYYVEDARGVRVADLHYSAEQDVTLALMGKAPFYVRSGDKEAQVMASGSAVTLKMAHLVPAPVAHRGSIEASFQKNLFKVPFGKGFYLGTLSAGQDSMGPVAAVPTAKPAVPTRKSNVPIADTAGAQRSARVAGWLSFGVGIGLGVAGGITYAAAAKNHDRFLDTTDPTLEEQYKETSRSQLAASRGLLISGGVLAGIGVILLVVDGVKNRSSSF